METLNARSLAQEAASWYLSHLDPCVPHADNVKCVLRGPVLALTLKVLQAPIAPSTGLEIVDEVEEEKKTSGPDTTENSSPWRRYLHRTESDDDVAVWNEQDQDAYDALGQRTRARMEAFLASCSLAVPDMSNRRKPEEAKETGNKLPKKPAPKKADFSLTEALAGFRVSQNNGSASSSPTLASIQASTALLRQISASSSNSAVRHPQFRSSDLATRIELYIRTLNRVRTLGRECVVEAEPPRALKARANALVMSFVATVGCVRSMGPSLTRLLQFLTKELLAEDVLGNDLCKVIRRLALEYEHQTSFASLAFLSSPEVSAQKDLTPMIISYLNYVQRNWENLVAECELERMLSTVLDSQMRHLFKTIEFRSIGHLLEVCQGFRNELHSIELPPCMGGVGNNEDVVALCSDVKAVKQAIRDLQREVLTVNGHVLPPVDSRKELVQLLSQTLNSSTLTASYGRRKLKKSLAAVHHSRSCPSFVSTYKENKDPESDVSTDYEDSSGNDADSDGSSSPERANEARVRTRRNRRHRRSFHLSTVDLMTRRLLIAASRTGKGGDAYFIVRDLFGGDDVEVVPSTTLPTYGRMTRTGTIEIVVRLASVTIKCHGSFDVYPKSLVGECEPLIQLHTTTTETINLQEVRANDSDDSAHSDDSAEGETKHVLREKKTDKAGWRTLTIRPALYEKVEVWNTPS